MSEEEKSHETSGESRAELEIISFLDRLRPSKKGKFTVIHPLENEGLLIIMEYKNQR